MKLSFVSRYSAFSRFMYIMVDVIDLCPRTAFTCIMSFVLWYSIVPFQWRSVWNEISFRRGLLSFWASALRCVSRYSLR